MFQKAAQLQAVSTKPVYVPKVELNHELIKGVCQSTSDLKTELKRCLRKPEEPPTSGNHPHLPTGPTETPDSGWVPSAVRGAREGRDAEHWDLVSGVLPRRLPVPPHGGLGPMEDRKAVDELAPLLPQWSLVWGREG